MEYLFYINMLMTDAKKLDNNFSLDKDIIKTLFLSIAAKK